MFDENKVTYTIECNPEYDSPFGNFATGDDDEDNRIAQSILDDLNSGNEWAWCMVRVYAHYDGIEEVCGEDTLGACSYASEKDFRDGGYFEDMKLMAKQDLFAKLEVIKNVLLAVD